MPRSQASKDKNRETSRAWYRRNKTYAKAKSKQWGQLNKERFREYHKQYNIENKIKQQEYHRVRRLNSYGLTLEDFNILVTKQNGVCLICDHESKLVVDHDHESGAVRGLLCRRCNSGIGMFDDSVERIKKALQYLGEN